MDGVRGAGMNPLSNQFMARALRTAQTQTATVKDEKDLKPKDDPKDLDDDHVTLSEHGQKSIKDRTDSASQSGVMSELMKREKKESLDEATMFGGSPRELGGKEYAEDAKDGMASKEEAGAIDLGDKLEALEIMNRDPQEIKEDVPEAYFQAAQKIVEGQIQKGKPADSLTQLKAVETAPLELKPMANVEIMDIHDTHNKPMSMDMGAEMSN